SAKEAEGLWEVLADKDAEKAYQAVLALADHSRSRLVDYSTRLRARRSSVWARSPAATRTSSTVRPAAARRFCKSRRWHRFRSAALRPRDRTAFSSPRRSAKRFRSLSQSLAATRANHTSQYVSASGSPCAAGRETAGSVPSGVGFLAEGHCFLV